MTTTYSLTDSERAERAAVMRPLIARAKVFATGKHGRRIRKCLACLEDWCDGKVDNDEVSAVSISFHKFIIGTTDYPKEDKRNELYLLEFQPFHSLSAIPACEAAHVEIYARCARRFIESPEGKPLEEIE
jgi:hypothetical protein